LRNSSIKSLLFIPERSAKASSIDSHDIGTKHDDDDDEEEDDDDDDDDDDDNDNDNDDNDG
jgi:hypothetical protein